MKDRPLVVVPAGCLHTTLARAMLPEDMTQPAASTAIAIALAHFHTLMVGLLEATSNGIHCAAGARSMSMRKCMRVTIVFFWCKQDTATTRLEGLEHLSVSSVLHTSACNQRHGSHGCCPPSSALCIRQVYTQMSRNMHAQLHAYAPHDKGPVHCLVHSG